MPGGGWEFRSVFSQGNLDGDSSMTIQSQHISAREWNGPTRGPFMALSAAGGIRPGVYAGLSGHHQPLFSITRVSAPFTGLLPTSSAGRCSIGLKPTAARRPVNGPPLAKENTIKGTVLPQPGVNAGPEPPSADKGRKRPSSIAAILSAATLSPVQRGRLIPSVDPRMVVRARRSRPHHPAMPP
jgi:hypothetical protein